MNLLNRFQIRTLSEREVGSITLQWAADEGWNPGLNDQTAFFATDSEGFLGGFIDDVPIACISAVCFDATFAFLGFYIVKPAFRGKGYGLALWNAAMQKMRNRNIGLDGVVEQQSNYKKSGFSLAYNNIRFCHQTDPVKVISKNIHPIGQERFADILKYDARLFPTPRPLFLSHWLNMPQSYGIYAEKEGRIQAYGVIRKCREGYKVGPLFANTPDFAEEIFIHLLAYTEKGANVYLDVPEPNTPAMELVTKYGMTPVFKTARMYTGNVPQIEIREIFGVTTFELG